MPASGAGEPIWNALADEGVTHLCGAPIVMSLLISAPKRPSANFAQTVQFFTAAAPPPESLLADMKAAGFDVTHLYGLTETYGPAVVNDWHHSWSDLPPAEQAALKARQGVRYLPLEQLDVLDPETMQPVPRDGQTMGEVMFRGNVVMKGYFRNPKATEEAFAGGWFHSGDLGVMHPDGYIQLKDRSKGHHYLGRREHLLDRGRGGAVLPPGCCGGGRGGNAAREMGRNPLRLCRAWPMGKKADAEVLRSWCRDPSGPLQGSWQVRVYGDTQNLNRQDPEICLARAGKRNRVITRGAALRRLKCCSCYPQSSCGCFANTANVRNDGQRCSMRYKQSGRLQRRPEADLFRL